MSNKSESKSRVIALRKIPVDEKQEEQRAPVNDEDIKVKNQIEIADLEQQIKSLKKQSEEMLFELKEQIQAEKDAWIEQKEVERKEAEEIGYNEGFQKAEEAVFQKYESLLQEANNIVEQSTKDYHRTVEKHEQTIVVLAIKAAERILTREIKKDETYVTSIIDTAMEDLNEFEDISIYVSPTDYELVMNQKEELEQSIRDGETLSIYVNTKLSQGDCIINHPFGQIDISLDLQLTQIKQALVDRLTEKD